MKEWLEEMTDKKEEEFRVQFKDSIQIMAGALKAGYSAENAIRETCHDLKPMYKSESRIIKEYEIMIRKLKIHIPVGQVLSEFAENVEQEDVDNFVTVFTTAQKSGGDSIVIIKDAVKVISEKMETEKENHSTGNVATVEKSLDRAKEESSTETVNRKEHLIRKEKEGSSERRKNNKRLWI